MTAAGLTVAASRARTVALRELLAQRSLPPPLCRLVASLLPETEALISKHDARVFGPHDPIWLRAYASVVDLDSFGIPIHAGDDAVAGISDSFDRFACEISPADAEVAREIADQAMG